MNYRNEFDAHPSKRKKFLLIPLLVLGAVMLFGAVVMWLWNTILPPVLGVKALTYWQALGLLVLCRLLFGGFRGGGRHHFGKSPNWQEKWRNMNEEERSHFRNEWKERCRKRRGNE